MPELPRECRECGDVKEADQFYRRNPTQRRVRCIPCMRRSERARRGNGQGKDNKLRREFGMTLVEYYQMMVEQGEVCAICEQPETVVDFRTGKIRELCVDHCHETGKVRALLCNGCNILVGHIERSVEATFKALVYLGVHTQEQTNELTR